MPRQLNARERRVQQITTIGRPQYFETDGDFLSQRALIARQCQWIHERHVAGQWYSWQLGYNHLIVWDERDRFRP